MLEVAVIGAGTSGLVAARHLIGAGLRPTIFEAAKTVGGAWTPSSVLTTPSSPSPSPQSPSSNEDHIRPGVGGAHHPASKMWNGLSTNLSKHTCRFSDWPWPEDASTFPSAEEMHNYLESYADAFLATSPSCNFQLECKVFNVEQLPGSSSSQPGMQEANNNYKVEWTDLSTQTTHSRDFGGVVVASGFFHTPRWPSFLKNREDYEENSKKPQLMHSSEYRSHRSFQDKNVAVIGASFSAFEIAADISRSASRVVNLSPSIPWVFPRWIPTMQPLQSASADEKKDITTMTILPIDLALYQRTRPYPQIPETVSLTPEDCLKRHQYLRSLVGHKQRQSPLGEPTNREEPAFVAISDEFLDLVREGKVEVVHGRLVGVDKDGTLQISDSQALSDIDHIICCSGYTSQSHNFLSPDMLSTLDYDVGDGFCPTILAWDTLHPSLPGLAFCGMHRGAYMGIMELQARLAAGVMSGSLLLEEEQLQSAMKTSQTIRNFTPRAQFPHFDYPGFIDTLSKLCYGDDFPKYNRDVGDLVVPAFYQPDDELSRKCQLEMREEIERGQDGSRMPKVVLQSILGKWSFDRHIVHLKTKKVERIHGTVKYSKYWERSLDDDDTNGNEMFKHDTKDNPVLYREDGLYEFSPTQKFEVFREYEYECKHDSLEIYFVEGGKRALLFLSLKFVPEAAETKFANDDGYWVKATSDHLCIKDLYSATFRVKLNGLSASEVIIKYRVKGPAKDYESTTILKPQWS
mmetsp:Transcript_3785/g.8300  ORF Transcript_3785/g.8300 Transcript_3785/m.8300 type:complete len:745 (-) Transcript_3785:44-2278(-)